MMTLIQKTLEPATLLLIIVLISVGALAAAFFSEAFLGLEPCELCITQRWPYAIAALLGVVGLAMASKPKVGLATIGLSGLAFFVNSGIAFYHSGIERHWWASALQGCSVPGMSDEKQSVLENIMSAPTGRCDEIPWADPLLGLSMANYNIVICFGLGLACVLSLYFHLKRTR